MPYKIDKVIKFLKDENLDINLNYLDHFWNCIALKENLYIGKKVIHILAGNTSSDSNTYKLYLEHVIKPNFEENIDYFLYDEEELRQYKGNISIDDSSSDNTNEESSQYKTPINERMSFNNFLKKSKSKNFSKDKLVVTPQCFRMSLLIASEEKLLDKGFINEYIKLQDLYVKYSHFTVHDLLRQLEELKSNHTTKTNKFYDRKHEFIIEKFKKNKCIYVLRISENLFKIGATNSIENKIHFFRNLYNNNDIMYVDAFICSNNLEVEKLFLNNLTIKNNIYNKKVKDIKLNPDKYFDFNKMMNILTNILDKSSLIPIEKKIESMNTELEIKKLELINKVVDKENLIVEDLNNIKISININNYTELLNNVNNEDETY